MTALATNKATNFLTTEVKDMGGNNLAYKPLNGMSAKKKTLLKLFRSCKKNGVYEFDNKKVKEICKKTSFGNPYDVTKIDHSKLLPDEVKSQDYCVVHLGQGKHCFRQIVNIWFHQLEPIGLTNEKDWEYKPSLLNNTDSSESNIISLVYNQRIIQDFLYGDMTEHPKFYMSRRTKITKTYRAAKERIEVTGLQVEMDATFERNGTITILEGKNGKPDDFAVYQLHHPFLDYHSKVPNAERIECCYLTKSQSSDGPVVSLYLYDFPEAEDLGSIHLIKNVRYKLKVKLQ